MTDEHTFVGCLKMPLKRLINPAMRISLLTCIPRYSILHQLGTNTSNTSNTCIHYQAGRAYLRQAETTLQTDSPNDAVQAFIEAANSYRKSDLEKSAKCYLSAIDIYNDTVHLLIYSIRLIP